MSLYQLMISRDNCWDIMNELLELEFLHYVPLNDHKQPHELLYIDVLRRCDEMSRKIAFIEQMYKDYRVQMQGPKDMAELEQAVKLIAEEKQCRTKQLIDKIEADVNEQERFLKQQHDMLRQSLKGFRDILSRIVVLRNVAKALKLDPDQVEGADAEANGLEERLIDAEHIETTGLAIIGGTILAGEENTLKRLLFRSTRGKAMLHTFDIRTAQRDVLIDEKAEPWRGYFVLFEDGPARRPITRVCKSFMHAVYETGLKTV